MASTVYPVISETAEKFVDFNDKYHGAGDQESLANIFTDLSLITEAMTDFIELEDWSFQ